MANVIAMIKASRADVVLVAMGNPLQERWLAENLRFDWRSAGFCSGCLIRFCEWKCSSGTSLDAIRTS